MVTNKKSFLIVELGARPHVEYRKGCKADWYGFDGLGFQLLRSLILLRKEAYS